MLFQIYMMTAGATHDPRHTKHKDLAHFEGLYSNSQAYGNETAALKFVRELYSDALAVPIPVEIGSGKVIMLGVVASPTDTVKIREESNAELPFVAIVRAVPETTGERNDLKKREAGVFTMRLWAVPSVDKPTGGISVVPMTIRAKAQGFPMITDATIGLQHGKVAIHAEWAPGESAVWLIDAEDLKEALRRVDRSVATSGVQR